MPSRAHDFFSFRKSSFACGRLWPWIGRSERSLSFSGDEKKDFRGPAGVLSSTAKFIRNCFHFWGGDSFSCMSFTTLPDPDFLCFRLDLGLLAWPPWEFWHASYWAFSRNHRVTSIFSIKKPQKHQLKTKVLAGGNAGINCFIKEKQDLGVGEISLKLLDANGFQR